MSVARFDAYRSLAFGSITNVYVAVGSPLTTNWKIFCITNNTNGDLAISADGITDNFIVPAMSFKLFDLSTNASPVKVSDNFVLAIGTQFYVRYLTVPSAGSVYVEGIYGRGIS